MEPEREPLTAAEWIELGLRALPLVAASVAVVVLLALQAMDPQRSPNAVTWRISCAGGEVISGWMVVDALPEHMEGVRTLLVESPVRFVRGAQVGSTRYVEGRCLLTRSGSPRD